MIQEMIGTPVGEAGEAVAVPDYASPTESVGRAVETPVVALVMVPVSQGDRTQQWSASATPCVGCPREAAVRSDVKLLLKAQAAAPKAGGDCCGRLYDVAKEFDGIDGGYSNRSNEQRWMEVDEVSWQSNEIGEVHLLKPNGDGTSNSTSDNDSNSDDPEENRVDGGDHDTDNRSETSPPRTKMGSMVLGVEHPFDRGKGFGARAADGETILLVCWGGGFSTWDINIPSMQLCVRSDD